MMKHTSACDYRVEMQRIQNVPTTLRLVLAMIRQWVGQIPKHRKQHLSAVFDIDDTVVHGGNSSNIIEPIREFYQFLRKLGVRVYFVTARPYSEGNMLLTGQELRAHGFRDFAGLYLMPRGPNAGTLDIARFKTDIRRTITESYGGHVLLTIGNSWHDVLPPSCLFDEEFVNQDHQSSYVVRLLGAQASPVVRVKLPLEFSTKAYSLPT